MSKIVVALGGNALQRSGEASSADQEKVAKETVKKLIPLIKSGHEIVIVHGNGPQVGNIVLHEEAINTKETPTMPLHACVAMTQGMIGFWIQKALLEELANNNIHKPVATVVTQVEVDSEDPAFKNPSKPIGPFYTKEESEHVSHNKGYILKEDSGRGWRRVVPSPKPIRIVEIQTIKNLLTDDTIVIAAGGGGIPVLNTSTNNLEGIDAVIDKDFAAEMLAEQINADILLILTAVDHAMVNFGKDNQEKIGKISVQTAKDYINDGQFAAGSMLPKIEASIKFAEFGGEAVITSLENAENAISKNLGTIISNQ